MRGLFQLALHLDRLLYTRGMTRAQLDKADIMPAVPPLRHH